MPLPMKIERVVVETEDKTIKTFTLSFLSEKDKSDFKYVPGQFAELFVLGKGEAPFGMASSPMENGLQFSVSKAGVVTAALHNLGVGKVVGIRGPLGNGYPMKELEGKNVVIIGGGFGFSTLRALTNFILAEENRKKFGNITVIYGARNPGLLLYRDDLEKWGKRTDLSLYVTVDKGSEDWKGRVGVVPAITKEAAPSPDNSYALVCGPPAMIKYTLPVVAGLGFSSEKTLLSLERKMKCGLGMCGRCNVGSKYVCKDGPVFSLAELKSLPGGH